MKAYAQSGQYHTIVECRATWKCSDSDRTKVRVELPVMLKLSSVTAASAQPPMIGRRER